MRTLNKLKLEREVPKVLFCDNGSELGHGSVGLSEWSEDRLLQTGQAYRQRVRGKLQTEPFELSA